MCAVDCRRFRGLSDSQTSGTREMRAVVYDHGMDRARAFLHLLAADVALLSCGKRLSPMTLTNKRQEAIPGISGE